VTKKVITLLLLLIYHFVLCRWLNNFSSLTWRSTKYDSDVWSVSWFSSHTVCRQDTIHLSKFLDSQASVGVFFFCRRQLCLSKSVAHFGILTLSGCLS